MKLTNRSIVRAIEDAKHYARYTCDEMADAMDISHSTLFRYLGDPSTMTVETLIRLQRIAAKYGVSIFEE